MTSFYCGGPESPDSLDMVGHFGFCTPVQLNLLKNVLFYHLLTWVSPKQLALLSFVVETWALLSLFLLSYSVETLVYTKDK